MIRNFIIVFSITILACQNTAVSAAAEDTVVIVNKSVVLDKQLTEGAVRHIFMLQQPSWQNALPVKVFVLPPDSELHNEFLNKSLHLYNYQLQKIWERRSFSGSSSPNVVDSSKEMLESVKSTPGAIGYLNRNDLPKNKDSGVLVIEVRP